MRKNRPLFEVEGLRVERDVVILDGVNWRVERGEHWAILGANGSGKTSLLRALTGYLMPSSGTVSVGAAQFGRADWRRIRQSIGLVSSSIGHQIDPEQTARDIIFSGREAQINYWGRPAAGQERAVAAMMRHVRVEHLAGRAWRHLSQGERQRVQIGRALMAQLRLLFLDEPCAGLDPVAREDFLQFLRGLARSPRAPGLVLVTHHVEEIVPLFTHVLLLRRGRVLAAGPKRAVLTAAQLGAAFGAPVKVTGKAGRYRLDVGCHAGSFAD